MSRFYDRCFPLSTTKENEGKTRGWKYEHRAKANHAVGVLKDRLIGMLIEEDPVARSRL
jgi:hypothetical protein